MKPSFLIKGIKYVIAIMALCLLVYLCKYCLNNSASTYNQLKHTEKLKDSVFNASKVIIEKAHADSVQRTLLINIFTDSLNMLNRKIIEVNSSFSKIKNNNHEQIIYITRLSSDSLSLFFTNRYGNDTTPITTY